MAANAVRAPVEPLQPDGALVVVRVDHEGRVLSVEINPMFKQIPVVNQSLQTSPGDLCEDNQPSGACDEEEDETDRIIGEYLAGVLRTTQTSHDDGSATKASHMPGVLTPQSETDVIDESKTEQPGSSSVVDVHRKPRTLIEDVRWLVALWAMLLTTLVVLSGVAMWCISGGTLDIGPYLRSGALTPAALAVAAVVAWSFTKGRKKKKKK